MISSKSTKSNKIHIETQITAGNEKKSNSTSKSSNGRVNDTRNDYIDDQNEVSSLIDREVNHRFGKPTLLTKDNFNAITNRLEQDDPAISVLKIGVILTEAELKILCSSIQNNTELGYVAWHKDQFLCGALKEVEIKLIDSNKNYQYHPNDYVHGLLSQHVYTNIKNEFAILDPNIQEAFIKWRVAEIYDDTKNSGYYGVIYINDKTHQVVLAHRGTEGIIASLFNRNSDWKTNIEEILGGRIVVGQQACNYRATAEAINIAKEAGYRLSFTGHSLGGWLAELSAFYCHAYFGYTDIKAVTFDSPGSVPMMEKLQSNIINKQIKLKDINIVTYLAPPNFVNCCNSHGGEVFLVKPEMKWPEQIMKSGLFNFVSDKFVSENKGFLSFEGNCLARILATFDPKTGNPKNCQRMADWPRIEYNGNAKEFSKVGNETVKEKIDPVVGVVAPMIVSIVKQGVGCIADGTTLGVLVNGSDAIEYIVKRTVEYTVDYAFDRLVYDTTLMTIIGFLRKRMDVNQEQFWAYYQLTLEEEGKENLELKRELSFDDRFTLVAKAKYREDNDIYEMHLLPGSVDKYLYKLYEAKEKLEGNEDLSAIVKIQLKELLTSFKIERLKDGKYQLVANQGHDVEGIRQKAQRFLQVLPQDALKIKQEVIYEHNRDALQLLDHLPMETVYYTEIREKREELDNQLKTKRVVIISGAGGMGKSTLAAEYGRNFKQDGWQVRWIKGMYIEAAFLQLAKDLKLAIDNLSPQEVRDEVYKGFIKFGKGQQVLLIFDNVEDRKRMKEYLTNLPNHVKVVITAKDGHLLEGVESIKLQGFGTAEATSYLRVALGISEGEAEKLIETVSESPFRLSKVVGYLTSHSLTTIDAFIEGYNKIKKGYDHNIEIYPEIEMLFGNLQEDLSESWQLLKYLAYLDAEGVSLELITGIMGKTTDELQRSINKLEQLSLMNIVTERNQKILKVSHRIVQTETRKALAEEDKAQKSKILEKLISELDKVFPDVKKKNYSAVQAEIRKASLEDGKNKLTKMLERCGTLELNRVLCYVKQHLDNWEEVDEFVDYAKILIQEIGTIDMPIGDNAYDYAKILIQETIYIPIIDSNKLLRLEKLITTLDKILSNPNTNPENWERVNEFAGHAKILINEIATIDIPIVGRNNLLRKVGSYYYYIISDYKEAIGYWEEELAWKKSINVGNHESIAVSFNNLGNAYCALGLKEKMLLGLIPEEEVIKRMISVVRKSMESLPNIERSNIVGALTPKEEVIKIRKIMESLNDVEKAPILSAMEDVLAGKENIRKGLKKLERSLKMRQALFSGNHPDIASSLYNIGEAYYTLEDEDKMLEYFKQAYGTAFAAKDYQSIEKIKIRIELLQPNFFVEKRLKKTLQELEYLGGNQVGFEYRWMIFSRGEIDDTLLLIKQKIQNNVLKKVTAISSYLETNYDDLTFKILELLTNVGNYGWSYIGMFGHDWGVKGYIEKGYLGKKLGPLSSSENIETAQMLSFESMNLGIMRCEEKPYEVVKSFTRENPELVKKIAVQHPEFFVDGSIVEACVKAMSHDESFQRHIFAHVKYMGMDARREQFSNMGSGF